MSDSLRRKQGRVHEAQALVDWSETSAQEEALLQRVEGRVLAHHDDRQQAAHTMESPGLGMVWGWWASAVGAVALAAVLLVAFGGRGATLLPLEAEGTLQLRVIKAATKTHRAVLATLRAAAKVRDPQGWSLRAHATTSLRIERPGTRRSRIWLQKGAASFHVTPGQMKQFEVICQTTSGKVPLRIVVKGTRFLVWRSASGLRVEVFRGHVLLKQGPRELLHLYKGQGAHISHNRRQRMTTYALADGAARWLPKIETMAREQIDQLYQYTTDLHRGKLLSHEQRQQALELAAHALQGAQRWAQASRLWLSLYRLKPRGVGAQSALFQAAQSCRRGRMSGVRCAGLYRRFVAQFPQGLPPLREASLFWLGRLQLRAEERASRASAVRALRRYLVEFPKGARRQLVRRLLSSYHPPTARARRSRRTQR